MAKLLIRFDHHTVWIGGRLALLRTYSWLCVPESEWPSPLPIRVSFTYAKGTPVGAARSAGCGVEALLPGGVASGSAWPPERRLQPRMAAPQYGRMMRA